MGDRGHFCDSMWPSRELGGSVGMHLREKWAGRTFMPNILVFDDQLATATPCTDVQKVLSLGGNKFRRSEILTVRTEWRVERSSEFCGMNYYR